MTTMIGTVGVQVEMDLVIYLPGIVARFDDWRRSNPESAVPEEHPDVYRVSCECFRVFDLWLVGVRRGRDMSGWIGGDNPADSLHVHVFPNVPMQSFKDEFWQFLSAIGVEKYELRCPWYITDVERAMTELARRAIPASDQAEATTPLSQQL